MKIHLFCVYLCIVWYYCMNQLHECLQSCFSITLCRTSLQWLLWVFWSRLQTTHQPIQHGQPKHKWLPGKDQVRRGLPFFVLCLCYYFNGVTGLISFSLVNGQSSLIDPLKMARILLTVYYYIYLLPLFSQKRFNHDNCFSGKDCLRIFACCRMHLEFKCTVSECTLVSCISLTLILLMPLAIALFY